MDSISSVPFNPRQSDEMCTLSDFKELSQDELNKYHKLLTMKANQDYKNRQILQITGNLIENLLNCLNVEDAKQIIQEKFKLIFGISPSFNQNDSHQETGEIEVVHQTVKVSQSREQTKQEEKEKLKYESYIAQSIIMHNINNTPQEYIQPVKETTRPVEVKAPKVHEPIIVEEEEAEE